MLNKKYIYCCLKFIVYGKLLKPRQSFRITLYIYSLRYNGSRVPPRYRVITKPKGAYVLVREKNAHVTFVQFTSVHIGQV
jgi:hypothetical protein